VGPTNRLLCPAYYPQYVLKSGERTLTPAVLLLLGQFKALQRICFAAMRCAGTCRVCQCPVQTAAGGYC